jgi:hypothetical protein
MLGRGQRAFERGVGLGRRRPRRAPGAGRPGAVREGNASLGGKGRGEKARWGRGVCEREEGGGKGGGGGGSRGGRRDWSLLGP